MFRGNGGMAGWHPKRATRQFTFENPSDEEKCDFSSLRNLAVSPNVLASNRKQTLRSCYDDSETLVRESLYHHSMDGDKLKIRLSLFQR